MIPPGFIQDLISRIDIVEVVGRHVELKKAGINHKGLCPFHGEKSPSFIVSPTRQTYHCFGCGVHGNAIGFLMEHSGLGFVEAVKDLAQQAGMVVPEEERSPEEREQAAQQKQKQATLTEVLERAGDHYRRQLKETPRAIDYLKKRGLTGEIAARFGIGYAPEGWRSLAGVFPAYDDPLLSEAGLVIVQGEDAAEQRRYDRFRDRIMFPIRSVQGDVIGFGGRVLDKGEPKYLNSPETPVFSKGRELYGLFEARQGLRAKGYALVVEGYMDVVALAQWGFPNAVATLGTACGPEHVQKLFRFTDSIVFSFDGDAAGRRAAGRALEAALPFATDTRTVRFLFLPTEHDPDSYIRELGPEAFERCVEQAMPLSKQLLEVASEGCAMDSAEGRARLLANVKPLWAALPVGGLKRLLIGEIAKLAQLPEAELMQQWQGGGAAAESRQRNDEPDYIGEPPAFDDYMDHGAPSAPRVPRRDQPWTPKPGGQGKWQGKGKWRDRGEAPMPPQSPRVEPDGPADNAVRMLLLHSDWWDQLSADDHQLLHELPGEHGALIAWLERRLVDHGPEAWPAMQAAMVGDSVQPAADRIMKAMAAEDAHGQDELRRVICKLWIERLETEAAQIAADAAAPGALVRLQQVRLQIQTLRAASQPAPNQ
ncbi:DNA primase [Roseateles toxinivorans]|uniref:DNA primase n=1 Tax=Roseateles toxinivorans TaxID=270368 RepID=A0A4R6QU16_9BURK|nr:DNA primase [Roseateles toxinivorans]TDP74252.1 DNA primase [Roseateles toxinivorans]